MVAWLLGLLAVAAPRLVAARGRSSGNNCPRQGTGYCTQWTDHSINPYAVQNPDGEWECMHGQVAIGLPDEWITVYDASGTLPVDLPPQEIRKSTEYMPDSAWVDDHTDQSGRCEGCGCQCDVVRALSWRCSELLAPAGGGSDPRRARLPRSAKRRCTSAPAYRARSPTPGTRTSSPCSTSPSACSARSPSA